MNKGIQAEQLACDYLLAYGLSLIQRNYRCPYGEIDLIMEDRDSLIFIEVRYRTHNSFGSALESITTIKQHKIITTAQHYLHKMERIDKPCRFDAIGITPKQGGNSRIIWLVNAFQLN
ncbi:YraN family protein [Candidatus Nitrosacidococcus tergens]